MSNPLIQIMLPSVRANQNSEGTSCESGNSDGDLSSAGSFNMKHASSFKSPSMLALSGNANVLLTPNRISRAGSGGGNGGSQPSIDSQALSSSPRLFTLSKSAENSPAYRPSAQVPMSPPMPPMLLGESAPSSDFLPFATGWREEAAFPERGASSKAHYKPLVIEKAQSILLEMVIWLRGRRVLREFS